jgi:hypothetical protein
LVFGNRGLRYDHAIPFNIVQKKLLDLAEACDESVAAILERFSVAALITAEEDEILNRLGLGNRMPNDWDGIDYLARYKVAGIEIVENVR